MRHKTYGGQEGLRDGTGAGAGELIEGLIVRNTIRQQAMAIGASAVLLPSSPLTNRISLDIFNASTGGQILYVGDATVTSVNGRPIYPRDSYKVSIEDKADIYGISSAAGADIRILEGA